MSDPRRLCSTRVELFSGWGARLNAWHGPAREALLFLAIAGTTGLLFYIDISLSQGTLEGYPYLLPLVGTIFIRIRYASLAIAGILALIAFIGWSIRDIPASPLDHRTVAMLNMAIAILGMFLTAAAIEYNRHMRRRLALKLALLRESEEFKGRLLAIIAHDLRSPLNPIIGFACLLAERGERMDGERIKDYGSTIADSARRLQETLDRLLQWSIADQGAAPAAAVPTRLDALVAETIDLVRPAARAKQIAIVANAAEDTISCDPVTVATVLRNLLSNAIKYSFAGATVTVRAHVAGSRAVVEVVDAGIGLHAEGTRQSGSRPHAASRRGTAGEEGSGIGLKICRSLAERAGYGLSIAAGDGHGTSARLFIPQCLPASAAPCAPARPDGTRKGGRNADAA
jgi:signal transduction histidine kinase